MLLLWMSIAGSIPLVIFLLTWLLQRKSFNYSLGKILLYLSMVFYLIPFQLLTRILPESMYHATIAEEIRLRTAPQIHFEYGSTRYVSIDDGFMWVPKWMFYILCIWFIVVFLFAIYQVVKYRKTVKYLLTNSEEKVYDFPGIGSVSILINNNIHTPYTVGFIRPHVIFPENLAESQYSTLIYRHEYCHAKNYDALVKLVCLIIVCLHWFNPLAILLLFSYGNLCEYLCDDYATKGLKQNERKEYANLLLNVAAAKAMPVVWRNNFSSTKYLFQRRLTYIMKKRFNKIQKLVTVVVSVVTVMASALTVFAYEPMQSSTEDVVTELSDGDDMGFAFGEDSILYDNIDAVDFSGYDDIFITESGEHIILNNNGNSYAICNHTFTSGRYYKHIHNSTGGCTVKIYSAQICTKCNYLVGGDLISTHTYVTCPHDN